MSEERIAGLIGLALRAGQLSSGEGMALGLIRTGSAGIALIDCEASENARKKLSDACIFRHVPLAALPPGMLERACGKPGRMAAAIKQGGLCDKLRELIKESQGNQTHILYAENAECGGASAE